MLCNDEEEAALIDPALENEARQGTFDITSYINDTTPEPSTSDPEGDTAPPPPQPQPLVIRDRKPRLGGKRIDMKAQRYVIDDPEDDHVDVETVSENGNPPVLEAGDLDSLLEQFEASEEFQNTMQLEKPVRIEKMDLVEVKMEPFDVTEEFQGVVKCEKDVEIVGEEMMSMGVNAEQRNSKRKAQDAVEQGKLILCFWN